MTASPLQKSGVVTNTPLEGSIIAYDWGANEQSYLVDLWDSERFNGYDELKDVYSDKTTWSQAVATYEATKHIDTDTDEDNEEYQYITAPCFMRSDEIYEGFIPCTIATVNVELPTDTRIRFIPTYNEEATVMFADIVSYQTYEEDGNTYYIYRCLAIVKTANRPDDLDEYTKYISKIATISYYNEETQEFEKLPNISSPTIFSAFYELT